MIQITWLIWVPLHLVAEVRMRFKHLASAHIAVVARCRHLHVGFLLIQLLQPLLLQFLAFLKGLGAVVLELLFPQKLEVLESVGHRTFVFVHESIESTRLTVVVAQTTKVSESSEVVDA